MDDDALVGTGEVARLLGVSLQRVHQLMANDDFPDPVGRLANNRAVWRRSDIAQWMKRVGREPQD